MAYKDILVQIDAAASPLRYEIAAGLAARAGGHLTGVFLKTTLINQYNNIGTVGFLPPEDLNRLIKENNEGQDQDAAKSADTLKKAAAVAKAECDWRVVGGDIPDDLISLAQTADLVVLPPPAPNPAYSVHASAVDICLAGCPVLLTPAEVAKTMVGEKALVAWNGSRESARALRDALPLLAPGAAVEVRIARPRDSIRDDSANLKAHLQRQGFTANVVVIEEGHGNVGDWLKAEAAKTGCDLIVMGLYGHTRLREFVLGGVSREMLHNSPLPLLISH
jgi:nucleotide-binding universal stress UspA family protein